jgi:hypothetical protein
LLDGKPRFIKSLGTDQPHRSEPPEAVVVAEWTRQINHLERRGPDKVSKPGQDLPARNMALPALWNKCADEYGRQVNYRRSSESEMLDDAAISWS